MPLKHGRSHHTCAALKNKKGAITHVIVAGGNPNSKGLYNSTEIFDVDAMAWHPGPDLPTYVVGGALVAGGTHESSSFAYLIGGYHKDAESAEIYALSNDIQSWSMIGTMERKRRNHVAVALPPEFELQYGSIGLYMFVCMCVLKY